MPDEAGLDAVVAPRASALMDSLRAFGYDMATALADLVDNSLAASASEVRVEFSTDEGAAWVAVVDDGDGMTEQKLHEAVRFGGGGPTKERKTGDLGRFGLGLKTASLSQCRVLTEPFQLGHRSGDAGGVRNARGSRAVGGGVRSLNPEAQEPRWFRILPHSTCRTPWSSG